MTRIIKLYKSYVYRDQDPIIGRALNVIADTGHKFTKVSADSGVSPTTLYAWAKRKTRSPRHETLMAVLRSCGKDMVIVDRAAVRRVSRARGNLKVVSGGKAK